MFPPRHEWIPDILNRFRLTGAVAEVGVDAGCFMEQMLARWTGQGPYYAVDHWQGSTFQTSDDRKKSRVSREHALAVARADPRCCVLEFESEAAADLIERESLDAVYIDAGHGYTDVHRDLKIWYDRVKPGGLVSGHDYLFNNIIHTQLAVDTFCRSVGTIARFNTEAYPSFYFFKGDPPKTIGVTAFTSDWRSKDAVRENRATHERLSGTPWVVVECAPFSASEMCWYKLELVGRVCRENPGAWVMWVDADAVVMDLRRPLSHVVGSTPYDMVVPLTENSSYNVGVFAVRADAFPAIRKLWESENRGRWNLYPPYDNGAFNDLMARDGLRNVEPVHHRICNSLPLESLWGAGDLIAHFAGSPLLLHDYVTEFSAVAHALSRVEP